MKIKLQRITQVFIETIGLSSPRGRLIFFMLLSLCIFILPPKWPVSFSVWRYLGIRSPSIGLTRAYRHVLHGDVRSAWKQNGLIFAVLIVGGTVLFNDVVSLTRATTRDGSPPNKRQK